MSESNSPTLDDLRALGTQLPPNLKVQGAEVADVLGAVAAVIQHGRAIIDAAQDGSIGVANFLHDAIAKQAETNGDPAPEKGRDLQEPAPVAQPRQQSQEIDYDKLAAAMVRAQAAATASTEASAPASDSPPDDAGNTSETEPPII